MKNISVTVDDGPLAVTVMFDARGNWSKVELHRRDAGALVAQDLRLKIGSVVEQCRRQLLREWAATSGITEDQLQRAGIDALTSTHPAAVELREVDATLVRIADADDRDRRTTPRDERFHLAVASIYAAACSAQLRDPIGEVVRWAREELGESGVRQSTAKNWVAKCRPAHYGFLTAPPAKRRPGGVLTSKAKRRLARQRLES